MKNKLKEFKQYCEQQICKIQEKYDLSNLQFDKNTKGWIISKYDNVCEGVVLNYIYNKNTNTFVYSVYDGYDIREYISGDDIFSCKEDAEKIMLYKSTLRNVLNLLGFEK